MKKVLLLSLFTIFISIYCFAQNKNEEKPKKAKLISQSCTQTDLFLTVVDLENNEMVILRYSYKPEFTMRPKYELTQVIRTGIQIDPENQEMVKGEDSPIPKEQTESPSTD